jgi:hypothetical protein
VAAPPVAHAPLAPRTILGSGTFGAVLSPALPNNVGGVEQEFPENVTKVFFSQPNMNSALTQITQLPAVMGVNAGHRTNRYTRTYRGRNLPRPVFNELHALNPTVGLYAPLHIVRMPDLGKDMNKLDVLSPELRNRPFRHILGQIHKLLQQTAQLAASGYGHFDIRTSNVMAKPSTGDLTIVDFDWLYPFNYLYDNYPLGFYSNPPESLFFERLPTNPDAPMPTDAELRVWLEGALGSPEHTQLETYVQHNLNSFKAPFEALGFDTPAKLKAIILTANVQNYKDLRAKNSRNLKQLAISDFFPFFDNYGLGLTLLTFIGAVYPYNPSATSPATRYDKAVLKTQITNEGTPYTDDELEVIMIALDDLIKLCKRMSFLQINGRLIPADVLEEMKVLLTWYDGGMNNLAGGARRKQQKRRTRRARRADRSQRRPVKK